MEANSVIVVLHVTVQLEEENDALTPAGRRLAANDTDTAPPVTRLALTPSAAAFPCTTERDGEAADNEMLVDTTGVAVVSVESGERVVPFDELVEAARK